MISKNSFFKLLIENMKQRIWSIALSALGFFVCLPVWFSMQLSEHMNSQSSGEYINHMLTKNFGFGNFFLQLLTILFAVICGLSGFYYLNSKKKTDFYHSIPVRREVLFSIIYINGLLIYLVPYVINCIFSWIAIQTSGFMNMGLILTSLQGIAFNLLFYTFLYTIVIISVMLTGNLIINFLAACVFFSYGTIVVFIKEGLFASSFFTYFSDFHLKNAILCSPLGFYLDTANYIRQNMQGKILGIALLTALLISCAVLLYRKRPSEAAGKAMAFAISKPVIKFLIIIPITLGGGMFFQGIVSSNSSGWFIFGLIFTFLLIYALIEIIYQFDIRKAFCNKKQILICGGIIVLISVIFKFDLFRYDYYLPKETSIKSMAISLPDLDSNFSYYEHNQNGFNFMSKNEYELKNMELTDFSSAYALAKLCRDDISHVKKTCNPNSYNGNYDASCTIKFTLKNGAKIYRSYHFPLKRTLPLLASLYANKEFKKVHYAMDLFTPETIRNVSCSNYMINKDFSLNTIEKKELMENYLADLNTLTLDYISSSFPIANLNISLKNASNEVHKSLYVYPSFQNTIRFLQNHGFNSADNFKSKDVNKITIEGYYSDIIENSHTMDTEYEADDLNECTLSYSDRKKMDEILPNLIPKDYYDNNCLIINANTNITAYVVINTDTYGNEKTNEWYFRENSVPAFVLQDIKKQK